MIRPMRVRLISLALAATAAGGCTSAAQPHAITSSSPTKPDSVAVQPAATHPSPAACHSVSIGQPRAFTLTAFEGRPTAALRLHSTFEVIIHGRAPARITTPVVTPSDAVCLVALSPLGTTRTATYFTLKRGHVTIAATITGVPGGVDHPLYGGRFTVR